MKTDQLLLINRICDQFESKLQAGSAVDIDQALESVKSEKDSQGLVEDLLPELIALKIVYSENRESTAKHLKATYPSHVVAIERAESQPSLDATVNDLTRDTEVEVGTPPPPKSFARMGERFENLEYLASGGLGDVYTGYDKSVKREVAIKLLKSHLVAKEEAKLRFLNEASITGALEHPGIVPIYDSGVSEDGRPYYVMRLFRGRTMKEDIKELHSDPSAPDFSDKQRQLVRRLADIGKAISYAHDNEVIHRDLKPANILLGQYGESIVIDWGLARRGSGSQVSQCDSNGQPSTAQEMPSGSDSGLTRVGTVLGTPGYMSPEQASGDSSSVGRSADIYSLGAVLYTIITGEVPSNDRSENLLLNSPGGRFSPIRKSAVLQTICARSMNQNPSQRYSDTNSFGADLECWLNDLPVAARPDTTLDWIARFLRKNRNWTLIAATTLLAIAIGSLIAASAFRSKSVRLEVLQKEAVAGARVQKALADENLEMANLERESGLKLRARQGVLESYIRLSVRENGDFSKETLKELILDRIGNFKKSKSIAPATMLEHADFGVYALSLITDHEEALRMHRDFAELRQSVNSGNVTEQIRAVVKESDLCAFARRGKEARELIEEFMPKAICDLGADHELTRELLRSYVSCLRGKKDSAVKLETIQLIYPWLGHWEKDGLPDSVSVEELHHCGLFARELCFLGKVEQGSALWSQLCELGADSLGATEVHALESLMFYAQAMDRFGDVELSLDPHRLLAKRMEDEFGPQSKYTIFIQMQLSRLLLETESASEALELLRSVRENVSSEGFRLKKDQAHLDVLYARSLLLAGEREQAVALIQQLLEKPIPGLGPRTERFRKSWKLAEGSDEMSAVIQEIEKAIERARPRWNPYLNLTVPH